MKRGHQSPIMLTGLSEKQVRAAAKAWLEWQFGGQRWEDASPAMKERFLEGARVILDAVNKTP